MLRRIFIGSREFIARNWQVLMPGAPRIMPPASVEAEAPAGMLPIMLARIGGYWNAIGETMPHWSVLTQQRFRPENIARHKDDFYGTGQNDLDLVRGLLAMHSLPAGPEMRVMEFGCGVGRATLALAGAFRQVTGCDISAAHLALAREEAAARGVANIAWFRTTIDQPMPDELCDLWFSRIVLQHNPPPVMGWLLRHAFRRLAPGGVAIFQVPTHAAGYRFAAADYLAAERPPHMEMHCLPLRIVFGLAAEAGLEVLDVREDTDVVGDPVRWISNLFVMRRPAG